MKYIFSFLLLTFFFQSCCSTNGLSCKECREFNKYVKDTWVYDKNSKTAYINTTIKDYGVKKSLDKLKQNLKCWEGIKVEKLEKILPFPSKDVEFKKDWFHVELAKECFDCKVKSIDCEKTLNIFPCNGNILIIQMSSIDRVKEVDLVLNNKYYGLEIK